MISARRRVVALLVAVVLTGVGLFAVALLALWFTDPFGHREIRSKLQIGLSESEVIRLIGKEPNHAYDRKTAPVD
jgi:hypothetical protein